MTLSKKQQDIRRRVRLREQGHEAGILSRILRRGRHREVALVEEDLADVLLEKDELEAEA